MRRVQSRARQRGGNATIAGETNKANRIIPTVFFEGIMIRMTVADYSIRNKDFVVLRYLAAPSWEVSAF